MTVKDIFDLRKQGRIEEAYEAIKARYKVYRWKYTTLCMFWTARGIFNIRMAAGRIDEARKIYEALKRVLPNIDDRDGKAAAFMVYAHRRLLQKQSDATPQNSCNPCNSWSPKEIPVLSGSLADALSSGQQAVLDCIKAHEGIKVPGISDLTNIPSKSIERHVSALIAHNLIEHRGSKKTGGYYVK